MSLSKLSYSEKTWANVVRGLEKSKEVQAQNYKTRLEDYNSNPTKCLHCSKSLDYKNRKNKFCNKSCAASYNNKIFIKRELKDPETKFEFCLNCNSKFKGRKRKFCNHGCDKEYKWKLRKEYFLLNNKWGDSENESSNNKSYKRYIIETRGHKCEICGGTDWMEKPIPLVLDHIDGNSNNNDLSNLRLVCGNCDMQLPTYKSKNRGSGRAWRRERYKQGKSY